MELHKSAGTLPELGSPVLGATRALPFPLLLALTASFPGRGPGRASGQAARGPAGRRAHERRPGARPGLWTWLQRAGSGQGQGVTRPRHVGCASSRPVPRALAPPGRRAGRAPPPPGSRAGDVSAGDSPSSFRDKGGARQGSPAHTWRPRGVAGAVQSRSSPQHRDAREPVRTRRPVKFPSWVRREEGRGFAWALQKGKPRLGKEP